VRRSVVVTVLVLVATTVPELAWAAGTPPDTPAVDLVRSLVGTQNQGNTFPGASAPFSMAQISPDTGGQGGYDHQKSTIYGFSQTHLLGAGGDLPIMPTTGTVTSVDPDTYQSAYSHDDEMASPGDHRVGLSTYGVNAELAATARVTRSIVAIGRDDGWLPR
jgi:putative alpha-1,2-mannosidase